MYFWLPDYGFSLKQKHVTTNKSDKNSVVVGTSYLPFTDDSSIVQPLAWSPNELCYSSRLYISHYKWTTGGWWLSVYGSWILLATRKSVNYHRGLGPTTEQSMWDLWWTKWHWDRFLSVLYYFSIIPTILHTNMSFICHSHYIILSTDSAMKQH